MKSYLKLAGIALAAYATVAIVQKKVMAIPVVGKYLPGGA